MTDRDDEGDPLLVRPYVRDEPTVAAPPASAPTWPEPATPADPTVVIPAAVPARSPAPERRRTLLLLAAILAVVLIGGAAVVGSLLRDSSSAGALPVEVPLPSLAVSAAPTGSATAGGGTTPPAAGAPVTTTGAPRTRATSSPPPAPATTAPTTGVPASRTATSSPPAELVAPPADRVGLIHGPGRLCLDLNGALTVDNNHVQVFDCNDTGAQVWTVAADGTLRVLGKCAAAADDGSVRITGCDGRRTAQWRTGPDRSLVNVARDACLTDPATGTRSGSGVRVESCSGADRQRWELP